MAADSVLKLIPRYIRHQCSDDEVEEVRRWMNQHPDNQQFVEELQEIWLQIPEEDFEVDVEEAWNDFYIHEIKKDEARPKVSQLHSHDSQKGVQTIFRVAAAILVVAVVGFFAWQYAGNRLFQSSQNNSMKKIITQRGEIAHITLPDGTVVTVNAASTLRFQNNFEGTKRVVYLDGEAYFNVTSNKEKPFIIYTDEARVKVFGTKFNVQAWNEDKVTEVVVKEGKVGVKLVGKDNPGRQVFLQRGEYVSVSDKQGISATKNVDISKYMYWLHGGMYFDNEPFSSVVRSIERKFDVHIDIKNKQLLNVPFTGAFRHTQLKEVLNVISVSMGVRYVRKDTLIQLIQ